MGLNVKQLVLIEGCYKDVILSESDLTLLPGMLKVNGDGFEVYINSDMIVSLELLGAGHINRIK